MSDTQPDQLVPLNEEFTYSNETFVKMHRDLRQGRESPVDKRLVEVWGEVLQWMDLCAAISSIKHARSGKLVTAQVDDMSFRDSLLEGDMLTVTGMVTCSWNSSMEVEVRLEAENLLEESQPRHICTSYFTFVLMKGSTMSKLPKLIPTTPEDEKKFYEAAERRRIRMQRRELINATSELFTSNLEHEFHKDSEVLVKNISDSAVCSSIVVLPSNANPHGNTFGGQIMGWMEEAARLACKKHARRRMYLCHIDDIRFISPSTVGDCLTIKAQVNRVYQNTLEVGVRVESFSFKDPTANSPKHINSGYLTYSCSPPTNDLSHIIGEVLSSTVQLPLIRPNNDREKEQYEAALGRRRVRVERRAISGCMVQSKTPSWSPLVAGELVLSNITNMTQVAFNVPSAWREVKNEDGMRICVLDTDELTLCRLDMILPYVPGRPNAGELFPMFIESDLRNQWDKTFKEYRLVEKIDDNNDIVHALFANDHEGDFDFCLLRSWRTPTQSGKENFYVVSSRSVLHDSVPEQEHTKRGYLLPSGFILSDLDNQEGIRVTYVIQVGASALQFNLDNAVKNHIQNFSTLYSWYTRETPQDAS